MVSLKAALPFLALDVEYALVNIGRGDVVNQLREAIIERWTYDEAVDAAYLHLRAPDGAHDTRAAPSPGEAVSVYDELGITLDTDGQGRLTGMEIMGGKAIVAQLEAGTAT